MSLPSPLPLIRTPGNGLGDPPEKSLVKSSHEPELNTCAKTYFNRGTHSQLPGIGTCYLWLAMIQFIQCSTAKKKYHLYLLAKFSLPVLLQKDISQMQCVALVLSRKIKLVTSLIVIKMHTDGSILCESPHE